MDDLPYSQKTVCSDKEILLSRQSSSTNLFFPAPPIDRDTTQQLVWTSLRFNDDFQFQLYQKIIGIIHPRTYLNVGKHETKTTLRGFGANFYAPGPQWQVVVLDHYYCNFAIVTIVIAILQIVILFFFGQAQGGSKKECEKESSGEAGRTTPGHL